MGSRWHPGHPELVLPNAEQRESVDTARGTGKGHCKAWRGLLGALGSVTGSTGGVTAGADGTGPVGRAMGQIQPVPLSIWLRVSHGFYNSGLHFPLAWGTAPLHPAGDLPQVPQMRNIPKLPPHPKGPASPWKSGIPRSRSQATQPGSTGGIGTSLPASHIGAFWGFSISQSSPTSRHISTFPAPVQLRDVATQNCAKLAVAPIPLFWELSRELVHVARGQCPHLTGHGGRELPAGITPCPLLTAGW